MQMESFLLCNEEMSSCLWAGLAQQGHLSRQFVYFLFCPAHGDSEVVQICFRCVLHLSCEFVVGLSALGQIGKVDDCHVGKLRLIQPFADGFYAFAIAL